MAGLHEMAVPDMRTMCVANFPLSGTRAMIMEGLIAILKRLRTAGMGDADVWVNGSFLTKKIDPNDVDLLFAWMPQSTTMEAWNSAVCWTKSAMMT